MAFIDKNKNLEFTPQGVPMEQQQTPQAPLSGSTSAPTVGSGGGAPGTGGVTLGGFTPIQSYLMANAGNTGSSEILNKKVTDQFGADKQRIDESSGEAKKSAQANVDSQRIAPDAASQLINQAGAQYKWGTDQQAEAYKSNVDKLRSGLSAQYAGPESWGTALSNPTTQYGSQLKDKQQFNTLMDNIYRESSGGKIGSGGLALQRQLDTTNGQLDQTRQALTGQYGELEKYLTDTAASTNAALGKAKGDVTANAGQLRSYLGTQAGGYTDKINAAIKELSAAEDLRASKMPEYLKSSLLGDGYPVAKVAPGIATGDPTSAIFSLFGAPVPTAKPGDYLKYAKSEATRDNARGVNTEKGSYNAIMEALGLADRVQNTEFREGGWDFDQDGFRKATGAGGGADTVRYNDADIFSTNEAMKQWLAQGNGMDPYIAPTATPVRDYNPLVSYRPARTR